MPRDINNSREFITKKMDKKRKYEDEEDELSEISENELSEESENESEDDFSGESESSEDSDKAIEWVKGLDLILQSYTHLSRKNLVDLRYKIMIYFLKNPINQRKS